MIKTISKTDYMRYLECPLYGWLAKHKRELMEDGENLSMHLGQRVEALSHELFDGGVEVKSYYEAGSKETMELIESGATVIYQAQAMSAKFLARTDILVKKKNGWHLYEVKSATNFENHRERYTHDLTFQANAFKLVGLDLKSINLIHVDNQYVFDEKKGLDVEELFVVEDLTDVIIEGMDEELKEMEKAHKILTSKTKPKIPAPLKKFEYDLPPLMNKEYYKDIPNYSIYNLCGGLKQEKVNELVGKGILLMTDIPEGYDLSSTQWHQIKLTEKKGDDIFKPAIEAELNDFVFPLYFLDYETISSPIPLFNGTKPYQQVPMQYSLHVLDKPGGELKHFEYLHTDKSSPFEPIAKLLRKQIGDKGTVIAWYMSFEKGRNTEIGEMVPKYKDFMTDLNNRMYDLMVIFKNSYDDYRFKGSFSLKAVLPALLPKYSYTDLEIQGGGDAMDVIYNLVFGKAENKERLKKWTLDYCERDTLVMVKLYEFLLKVVTSQ